MEIKFDTSTLTARDALALRVFLMNYEEFTGDAEYKDQSPEVQNEILKVEGSDSKPPKRKPKVVPPPPPPPPPPAVLGNLQEFTPQTPQTPDFFKFLADVSAAIAAGKITQTQVTDMCVAVNVAALPMLINKPEELEMVVTRFNEVLNVGA